MTIVLYSLLVLLRDLAILAGATGLAWWAWDRRNNVIDERNEEAAARSAAERAAADARQSAARVEALAARVAAALEDTAAASRAGEGRAAAKAEIHRLLHASKEPFLTFAEIRAALPGEMGDPAIRRLLIELTADRVVAQLEGDRYFIASDYDADEDDGG